LVKLPGSKQEDNGQLFNFIGLPFLLIMQFNGDLLKEKLNLQFASWMAIWIKCSLI